MLILIIVFIFGIIIGSFLNVCIYRIPKGESIVYPGSHCMACQHALDSTDLIPVISYLCLKGRCRYCGTKISSRYMLIETLTGLIFLCVYLKFGVSVETILYAVFAALLIVLTMIDWDYMLLPTKIIGFGVLAGIGFKLLQVGLYHNFLYLKESIIAACIGYGTFYLIFYLARLVFKKDGLGFGDVRLMGMLGIFLPVHLLFLTILIASIAASLYGLILLYIKKANDPFPFGPFLNIGAFIALFWGQNIIKWYFGIIGA